MWVPFEEKGINIWMCHRNPLSLQQNNRPNLPTKNNMKRYNYSLLVLSLLINSTYAQDMSTTASSKSDSIKQLADVTITAQLAIPRRTPVAASNVSASQIEERLGNGEFVEIHGRDLVDLYVGWTAQKVKDTVAKAIGGVLFIDEAYSLVSDHRGGYEDEAIATLIKEMEDHREEICIILAGYTDEMRKLIKLNPGFESRIQFTIEFPDYSKEELLEIFLQLCKNEKYKISPEGKEKLLTIFEKAKKDQDFGNGRYVRNIFEKIKFEQADRIAKTNSKQIDNIIVEDIYNAINSIRKPGKENHRKIGF